MSFGHEFEDAYTVDELRQKEIDVCRKLIKKPLKKCRIVGGHDNGLHCCHYLSFDWEVAKYNHCMLLGGGIENVDRPECTEYDFTKRLLEIV